MRKANFKERGTKGSELTPLEHPNHVLGKFSRIRGQPSSEVRKGGVIVPWAEITDVSQYSKPHKVVPLGVEPSKPRAVLDTRSLNLMGEKCRSSWIQWAR